MILLHKIYSICKERSISLVSLLRRSRMVQASLCLALVAITLFYTTIHVFTVDMEHVTKDTISHYIYIDRDDSPDSVRYKSELDGDGTYTLPYSNTRRVLGVTSSSLRTRLSPYIVR